MGHFVAIQQHSCLWEGLEGVEELEGLEGLEGLKVLRYAVGHFVVGRFTVVIVDQLSRAASAAFLQIA